MYDRDILSLIFQLSRLPLRVYDAQWEKRLAFGEREASAPYDREMFEALRQRLRVREHAFCAYDALVPIALCGCCMEGVYYVLGPFCYGWLETPESRRFLHVHRLGEYPVCRLETVGHVARFLSRGARWSAEEASWEAVDPILEEVDQLEAFQENHTYREEQALYDCIREGDVVTLEERIGDVILPHPMVLEDVKRNEEYMAVTGVSLAARAAVEGGLSSREAFLYNDLFLRRVAECGAVWEMHEVQKECCLCFARLVRGRRRQGQALNRHVEECKRAIVASRFAKTSVDDLAKAVGISREYLQKLFKKHEGVPITEYIARKKLEAACNMLAFSDRKISEIADYLHFGSASHFSVVFRRKMCASPSEYRERCRCTSF